MWLNRTCLWLASGVLVLLLGLPAVAQGLRGMQLFAPADVSPYGTWPRPKEGYFFVFDGLDWSISAPNVTTIGEPNLTRTVYYGIHPVDDQDPLSDAVIQSNTLDTGSLGANFTGGNRMELGRVFGHHGWLLSFYRLKPQTQRYSASSVDMVFIDPEFGPRGSKLLEGIVGTYEGENVIKDLPLTFDEVSVINRVKTWNVELMYICRREPCRHGGIFEWFFGVRYLDFKDLFEVNAFGKEEEEEEEEAEQQQEEEEEEQQVPAILADSTWTTDAENHIVGPQIGLRWFRKRGRLMFSTEGRYLAGFNSQNIRQQGTLGSKLNPPGGLFQPLLMDPTSFNHSAHPREYTNLVELRADLRYQLTRAVSFRAGWTGIWMDNIARASNMINYEVPDMGLRTEFNQQDVFIHGLTIGVDVNR